ncbi:Phosphoglycerate kinase [Piscirickettsia salmonis]|uniref:Phosphoglycerate kinase n=1 Tax=Piscirickettsia salmonis TaxID=1238 RepID=A0A1L6TH35_PISSA|nr:phosphoglycerate kinase [Piscirickettsia salmonis]AKP73063.1 phosphoglycerate kinase [Piscirickettsia salmonis LF-89 = ATCC VR-1361]ALB21708.1 phosphoglycerate kinase [Piscirickettsia salmonis]ALY01905.1 phosphoglycerate kinase [Piscirickettsia salmonis]AMA41414.1 phosphoglycerate kinase [Piscirickettsia salmonis]AOS36618.1 phosphoglycerate kinase [Piscirickettsia salmonis]
MNILEMEQLNLDGKRVLIREDLNVPLKNGQVTSDARLLAALPTIQQALAKGAAVIVMSHLGRPTEGEYDTAFSLAPVAERLAELLGQTVRFEKEWLDGITIESGEIVLCENVRFNLGEKKNDPQLAKKMADLCDVFVMDAFATSHRAQASTVGVGVYAKEACAGRLLMRELNSLGKALMAPERPLLAVVGGSKVSTKLTVLKSLAEKVDQLIVGGGIANTFLAAQGINVGSSLYEAELLDEAQAIMSMMTAKGGIVALPEDVRVATEFSEQAHAQVKNVADVADDEMILDIGPKAQEQLAVLLTHAKTIVWNGPLGVFEFDAFGEGTKALSAAIAESSAFSLAGGGDTIAAIEKYQIEEKISYISTAGGAFLEFLEGKTLPAVDMLSTRARSGV